MSELLNIKEWLKMSQGQFVPLVSSVIYGTPLIEKVQRKKDGVEFNSGDILYSAYVLKTSIKAERTVLEQIRIDYFDEEDYTTVYLSQTQRWTDSNGKERTSWASKFFDIEIDKLDKNANVNFFG